MFTLFKNIFRKDILFYTAVWAAVLFVSTFRPILDGHLDFLYCRDRFAFPVAFIFILYLWDVLFWLFKTKTKEDIRIICTQMTFLLFVGAILFVFYCYYTNGNNKVFSILLGFGIWIVVSLLKGITMSIEDKKKVIVLEKPKN
jgi:hypothetical protein